VHTGRLPLLTAQTEYSVALQLTALSADRSSYMGESSAARVLGVVVGGDFAAGCRPNEKGWPWLHCRDEWATVEMAFVLWLMAKGHNLNLNGGRRN
jgi:hypothetical protein